MEVIPSGQHDHSLLGELRRLSARVTGGLLRMW